MTTPLVLATHNAHKVEELRTILGDQLGDFELVGYDGPEPVEDGETFEANALIKARAAFLHTGNPSIADDSGISADALDGAPGIHSARYAGTRVDEDNRNLLLARMSGATDRAAHFTCAAAYVDANTEHVELAIWPGTVLEAATGEGGFGYDPVFQPEGLEVSAAQLTPAQKNAISHRTMAFERLVEFIGSLSR